MNPPKDIPGSWPQRMDSEEVNTTLNNARKFAKSSCKRCYGTGVMGTKVVSVQEKTILICHCVESAVAKYTEQAKALTRAADESTEN